MQKKFLLSSVITILILNLLGIASSKVALRESLKIAANKANDAEKFEETTRDYNTFRERRQEQKR